MLIMNKCDLVSPETVAAWTAYFRAQYPALKVVTFTSFQATTSKKKHRQAMKVVPGVHQLVKVWRELGLPGADEWAATAEAHSAASDEGPSRRKANSQPPPEDTGRRRGRRQAGPEAGPGSDSDGSDSSGDAASGGGGGGGDGDGAEKKGFTTIGMLGQPNVGKSTVLNALMGEKVVSTSITPGRTKHFQTHFMTPTIELCDCPGLVFPASAPKALQVLAGIYLAAQLREPYSAVQFLACNDFDNILLRHLRIPQLRPTPHAPCGAIYLAPMLIGC